MLYEALHWLLDDSGGHKVNVENKKRKLQLQVDLPSRHTHLCRDDESDSDE